MVITMSPWFYRTPEPLGRRNGQSFGWIHQRRRFALGPCSHVDGSWLCPMIFWIFWHSKVLQFFSGEAMQNGSKRCRNASDSAHLDHLDHLDPRFQGWNHLKTSPKPYRTGSRTHRRRWFRHEAEPFGHVGNLMKPSRHHHPKQWENAWNHMKSYVSVMYMLRVCYVNCMYMLCKSYVHVMYMLFISL